ncbi:hypothetical protein SBRY_50276 [Actinacidiphila bryophytorum]|uniref:Uncharacterized protein n=1 Tax=Actinacidiphila bryophytorum TaxID=1436133 RepID=A0A9W4MI75_9ACTN|nr:hypothetical protein SBRY_50276 [Actinacidiphila bryophytorum]
MSAALALLGGTDLFFRGRIEGPERLTGARAPSFQHHLPVDCTGLLLPQAAHGGWGCGDRGCVTGDHLPIRGLRYPGGHRPDPGDPDGVLLLTSSINVHLPATLLLCDLRVARPGSQRGNPPVSGSATALPDLSCIELLARQFVPAAPHGLSGHAEDTNPPRRQCLPQPLQIFCGVGAP